MNFIKKIIQLLATIVLTVTVNLEVLGADCSAIEEILAVNFGLPTKQRQALLSGIEGNTPEQILALEGLLKRLPPLSNRAIAKLKKGAYGNVFTALKTLFSEDPLKWSHKLLKSGVKPTPNEQFVLDVMVEQSWRISRWYRYVKPMADKVFVLGNILRMVHERRAAKLGESTTLEYFLARFDFHPGEFNVFAGSSAAAARLANAAKIVQASGNVENVIKMLQVRQQNLRKEILYHSGFAAYELEHELRKGEAFLAMLQNNKDGWRTDSNSIQSYVRGPVSIVSWLSSSIYRNWPERINSADRFALTAIVVMMAMYTQPRMIVWYNDAINSPPEPQYSTTDNVFRDAKPLPSFEPSEVESERVLDEINKIGSGTREEFLDRLRLLPDSP